ncbi:MAG: hypothetical protein U9R38_07385 [Candidatus Margulisiibacteriota bacterium]|nr:hypothetical protein [Candidatus Margulisiibacteriota bacterium]
MKKILLILLLICVGCSVCADNSKYYFSNQWNMSLYPMINNRFTVLKTNINDRDMVFVNAARGGMFLYGYNNSYRLTSYVDVGKFYAGLSVGGSNKISGLSFAPALLIEGEFPLTQGYMSEILIYSDSISVQPTFNLWQSPVWNRFRAGLKMSFAWTYDYSGIFGAIGGASICIDYIL